MVTHPEQLRERLEEQRILAGDLFLHQCRAGAKGAKQAEYLSPRYHVVVGKSTLYG